MFDITIHNVCLLFLLHFYYYFFKFLWSLLIFGVPVPHKHYELSLVNQLNLYGLPVPYLRLPDPCPDLGF